MTSTNQGPAQSQNSNDPLASQGFVTAAVAAATTSLTAAIANSLKVLPGARCATFGDSIIALSHQGFLSVQNTSGGFVVDTQGNATIVATSPHGLGVGDWVHLWNLLGGTTGALYANNLHTLSLDGAFVQVTGVTNSTTFTVNSNQGGRAKMAAGDYSGVGASGIFWRFTSLKFGSDQSWFRWMNAFLGGSLYISAMYAAGSSISNDAIQWINQVQYGPSFDVALISVGTNDIEQAALPEAAATTALANIQTLITALNARGAFCIVTTPPPSASGNFHIAQGLANARYGLLQMAQRNSQMRVLDLFAEYCDGTTASGGWANAAYSTDNVHAASQGLYTLAFRRSQDVSWKALWLQPDVEPVTISDDLFDLNASNPSPPWPNFAPAFTGTGGTTGGATGTVPTNWTLAAGGGLTASTITATANQAVIAQANTNQAKWGTGLGLSIPFTANNQTVTVTSPNLLIAYTGVPAMKGNWYRASFTVTAAGNITAGVLKSITGQFTMVGGNSAGTFQFFGGDANAFVYSNGYPFANNDRLVITSDPFWLPNDASISAMNISLLMTSGTVSGTAALQISQPQLKQIQNPYV